MTVNQLNYDYIERERVSVDDMRKELPLQATTDANSLMIRAKFNGEYFIDNDNTNANVDQLTLRIKSFETDLQSSTAVDMSHYKLLPCERLKIALELEQHLLYNGERSPCRHDYPDDLKQLLKHPMDPPLFFNPIFAPELPYDKTTCEHLCATRLWLPKCRCYGSSEIWQYAGFPNDTLPCPPLSTDTNCTQLSFQQIPISELNLCKCFLPCSSFKFNVAFTDKVKYSVGKRTLSNRFQI